MNQHLARGPAIDGHDVGFERVVVGDDLRRTMRLVAVGEVFVRHEAKSVAAGVQDEKHRAVVGIVVVAVDETMPFHRPHQGFFAVDLVVGGYNAGRVGLSELKLVAADSFLAARAGSDEYHRDEDH